jgi:hypothetical protein
VFVRLRSVVAIGYGLYGDMRRVQLQQLRWGSSANLMIVATVGR